MTSVTRFPQFTTKTFRIDSSAIDDTQLTLQPSPIIHPDEQIGVLTLTAPNSGVRDGVHNIVFSCDRSGSMGETPTSQTSHSSKTPMDFLKHTLKNILHFLARTANDNLRASRHGADDETIFDIRVTVLMFDHEVNTLIDNEPIRVDNVDTLCSRITPIDARGGTNICEVIRATNRHFVPGGVNTHIFMTDGEPTIGIINKHALAGILDDRFEHVFIGYGQAHNSDIMNTLANKHGSAYYMVDNFENAGMVYGEILHTILYRKYDKIKLHTNIPGAQIYNARKNRWVTSPVQLEPFASEETRDIYIKFKRLDYENFQRENSERPLTTLRETLTKTHHCPEEDTPDGEDPPAHSAVSLDDAVITYVDIESSRLTHHNIQHLSFSRIENLPASMRTATDSQRLIIAHYVRLYTMIALAGFLGVSSSVYSSHEMCNRLRRIIVRLLHGGNLIDVDDDARSDDGARPAFGYPTPIHHHTVDPTALTAMSSTQTVGDPAEQVEPARSDIAEYMPVIDTAYEIMLHLRDDLLIVVGAIQAYGFARWYSQIEQRTYNLSHIPLECERQVDQAAARGRPRMYGYSPASPTHTPYSPQAQPYERQQTDERDTASTTVRYTLAQQISQVVTSAYSSPHRIRTIAACSQPVDDHEHEHEREHEH
jgi:hypothetical protein